MSHTRSGARRFGRLAAGLVVTAAATTLLGAVPASAQGSSVAVSASAGRMLVTGTGFGESITASGSNGTVFLSNLLGSVTAGQGCTQLGATVRCTDVNVVMFAGLGGDDTYRNDTAIRSILSGGVGNDRITGGPGKDTIRGGDGVDFAFGRGGVDACVAENEVDCES